MRSASSPLSIGFGVGLAMALILAFVTAAPLDSAQSREPDHTLKLFFGHTGERGVFTFKRNGRYDRAELDRINEFLRDWRREESTHMDPQLLDLVWAIYQQTGSDDYVHVVSAYRSPQTNSMLRSRSNGVAKNSQHIRGKAMDFFIPDVPLADLRAIAMKMQGGGVGYYPTSGSPFVHVDTGSVRAWPRMSRQQLLALFPNGETLHLPTDGKPLPGYEIAVARREASPGTTLAYLETEEEQTDRTGTSGGGVGSWLRRVLPGGGEDATETAEAPETPAAEQQLANVEIDPRMPRPRPATEAELAAAEEDALPVPAHVTPADADALATLAYAPLPRTRPDPVFLAESLAGEGAATLPVPDVSIGELAADSAGADSGGGAAADDPIALAFAALEDAPELPSAEDSAVIAAFAAMRAAEKGVVVASAAAPTTVPTPAGTGGVVIPPDQLPGYQADANAINRLIETPAAYDTYDPQFARLNMPVPATDAGSVYRVPEAAEVVADLGSGSQPPVNRFATGETAPQPAAEEQGFFVRLFASLIE